ncbi:MAG: chemotaxis protein CheW, partial [Planctomycetaceae bacterium]
EVVVKPLHSVLRRLGVYGGAALLGDGRVALIASVEGMARQAGVLESADDTGGQPPAASSPPRDPRDVHRVLLFESGPDERFALPLVQIRRLVLVDPTQFETVQGAEYFTVDGVSTRIVALDSVLNVSPTGRVNPMFLLLPKFVPEPVAILASRIIDTDTLMVDLQPAPPGQPGVLGTALIRERLTLFLHLQHIRERVYGIPPQELPAATPARARHILLIDD